MLTVGKGRRVQRREYHTRTDLSKDIQLVFSNAMGFNSEESQIHEEAQTLKVCSLQAVVHHSLLNQLP